jgi:hypothetical protein
MTLKVNLKINNMRLFKKVVIPSGEQSELLAYESWSVRWNSRSGECFHETRPESEVFTSKEDAYEFAEAIKDAFRLLKYSGSKVIDVQVTKNTQWQNSKTAAS